MNYDIFELANVMVNASGGRLRVAHNEQDNSTDSQTEAAHFLKVDEKRLGRDLELYSFMSEIMGWPALVATLLAELLLPIKSIGPVYDAGREILLCWGRDIYTPEQYTEFVTLF